MPVAASHQARQTERKVPWVMETVRTSAFLSRLPQSQPLLDQCLATALAELPVDFLMG